MNAELVKEIDKSIKLLEELQQMQLEKYGSRRFQADYAMLTLEKLSALNQSQPSLPSVEEEEIAEKIYNDFMDNAGKDEQHKTFIDDILSALRQHRGWNDEDMIDFANLHSFDTKESLCEMLTQYKESKGK